MGIAETIRLKMLSLKDACGIGLTVPTDNRVHLDAAVAWLKHAQDVKRIYADEIATPASIYVDNGQF